MFHSTPEQVLSMAALGTLPIVTETAQQPVWDLWDAQWRDLFILDRNGDFFNKVNLTELDPDPAVNGGQNYALVKSLFVSAHGVNPSQAGEDQAFVTGLYQDLLGRAPDAGGLGYFTSLVAPAREAALPPTTSVFVNSPEYRNNLVSDYYTRFLGRSAGTGDLAYWGQVYQAAGAEQVAAAITGSAEYINRQGGSATAWLQALYPDLLHRPIQTGEQTFWVSALQAGATPTAISLTIATSTEARNNLVSGYYTQFLKRSASPGDLAYWVGQMARGQRDEQVLAAIASSREAFAKSGDTITSWVTAQYQGILRRSPDAAGVNYFVDRILTAYAPARQTVATILANSDEAHRRATAEYFSRLLGRSASDAELTAWVGLRRGMTAEQQVAAVVASPEYFQRAGGTNTAWLDQMYRDVLGRARDAGSAGFLNGLNAGTLTRQQVATAILGSPEYRTRLVESFYSRYLGRSANAVESGSWASRLAAGSKDEDVIGQLLGANEYARQQHQLA